jgi:hypothetical protein
VREGGSLALIRSVLRYNYEEYERNPRKPRVLGSVPCLFDVSTLSRV